MEPHGKSGADPPGKRFCHDETPLRPAGAAAVAADPDTAEIISAS